MMTRADFMQAWRFAHEIRLVLKEKPEGQAQREEVALKMFKAAIRFHLELRRWTTSHVSYPHVMIAHAPRAIARLGCIAPFGASGCEHDGYVIKQAFRNHTCKASGTTRRKGGMVRPARGRLASAFMFVSGRKTVARGMLGRTTPKRNRPVLRPIKPPAAQEPAEYR